MMSSCIFGEMESALSLRPRFSTPDSFPSPPLFGPNSVVTQLECQEQDEPRGFFASVSQGLFNGIISGSKAAAAGLKAAGTFLSEKLVGSSQAGDASPDHPGDGEFMEYYLVKRGLKRKPSEEPDLEVKRRSNPIHPNPFNAIAEVERDEWSGGHLGGLQALEDASPPECDIFQMPFRTYTQIQAIRAQPARYSSPNSPFRRPPWQSGSWRGKRNSASFSTPNSPPLSSQTPLWHESQQAEVSGEIAASLPRDVWLKTSQDTLLQPALLTPAPSVDASSKPEGRDECADTEEETCGLEPDLFPSEEDREEDDSQSNSHQSQPTQAGHHNPQEHIDHGQTEISAGSREEEEKATFEEDEKQEDQTQEPVQAQDQDEQADEDQSHHHIRILEDEDDNGEEEEEDEGTEDGEDVPEDAEEEDLEDGDEDGDGESDSSEEEYEEETGKVDWTSCDIGAVAVAPTLSPSMQLSTGVDSLVEQFVGNAQSAAELEGFDELFQFSAVENVKWQNLPSALAPAHFAPSISTPWTAGTVNLNMGMQMPHWINAPASFALHNQVTSSSGSPDGQAYQEEDENGEDGEGDDAEEEEESEEEEGDEEVARSQGRRMVPVISQGEEDDDIICEGEFVGGHGKNGAVFEQEE